MPKSCTSKPGKESDFVQEPIHIFHGISCCSEGIEMPKLDLTGIVPKKTTEENFTNDLPSRSSLLCENRNSDVFIDCPFLGLERSR